MLPELGLLSPVTDPEVKQELGDASRLPRPNQRSKRSGASKLLGGDFDAAWDQTASGEEYGRRNGAYAEPTKTTSPWTWPRRWKSATADAGNSTPPLPKTTEIVIYKKISSEFANRPACLGLRLHKPRGLRARGRLVGKGAAFQKSSCRIADSCVGLTIMPLS